MRPIEDRSDILLLLATERFVPASELAGALGLSEASARQVIQRLRARGIGIEVEYGEGYRRAPHLDRPWRGRPTAKRSEHTFGGLLTAHRKRLGMTQFALARRTAIEPSTISVYECGHVVPPRPIVDALIRALDLDGVRRDRLLVLAGYCPPTIAELSPQRLQALLVLANEGAAA